MKQEMQMSQVAVVWPATEKSVTAGSKHTHGMEWDTEENREKSNFYLTKVIKKFEGKKTRKLFK